MALLFMRVQFLYQQVKQDFTQILHIVNKKLNFYGLSQDSLQEK